MTLQATWPQALAWRMRRQLLDPIGAGAGRRRRAPPRRRPGAGRIVRRARRSASVDRGPSAARWREPFPPAAL